MLIPSAERNQYLCGTDAGTPTGDLLRGFWAPILLSSELPKPDCPPVKVRLMGEELIAFRDTAGRLGLFDQFWTHRGVSLWFARIEEFGIRCPYHGWKYDVTGQCFDLPSEQDSTGTRARIKLQSCACIEKAGVIWGILGSPEQRPPEPALECTEVGPGQVYVSKRL